MNTLSDVDIRRGGTDPLNAGLTSDVLPKAQGSLTGVSVRYAPDPDKQWFVLRVTYNRISKVYNYFSQDNTEAYFPMHYVQKTLQGKKKRVLAPLLPNILFVYASSEKVETYVKHTPDLPFLTYYYDHFRTINGKNPPLTIPYDTMMNFIRLTSVDNDFITLVEPAQCRYKSGDMVKIVEGDFAGVVGKVARVSGQQRVVVEIENLCWVATAYIPTGFIRKL